MTKKLLLLDRDGVINQDLPQGVTSIKDFAFLKGSIEAITTLTQAGFHIAIITNQSAIGKGLMSEQTLHDIHHYLKETIKNAGGQIDQIYYCPDHPDHPTNRRKPAPGMILEALADFNVDAAQTPLIGDALRDLEAAHSAGCPYYLVKTGKGDATFNKGLPKHIQPIHICANLLEATKEILRQQSSI